MKNNEIMISARFKSGKLNDEIAFLVLKDISLKAFIEAVYYGLKKSGDYEEHVQLLEEYIKTRKELQVLYNAKADFQVIDFAEEDILGKKLDELGFVTSSCVLFTTETVITPQILFEKTENSYILKAEDTLEYNISTRRLNVIESSVIDILPPGEMPKKKQVFFSGCYYSHRSVNGRNAGGPVPYYAVCAGGRWYGKYHASDVGSHGCGCSCHVSL